MELYYTLRNRLSLLLVPMALLTLVSCGSYQYSGYEADGIYGESRPGIWEQQEQEITEVKPNNENAYYKNLFAQQSEMVGEVLESDVFTDVDSYSSNDGYENYSEVGGDVAYVGGNAPWGEDPDSYTINIINNGFYPGFYSPWRYGYGYGRGYGHPYYGGWYDPYWPGGWGGFGPYGYAGGWNIGFGFGHGFGYGFGRGYGGYYNPYYPHHYNNYNYYNQPYNNNVAYNNSRRNSTASYREGQSRRSSYSERIRDIRNSRSSDYGTSRVRNSAENSDARVYTRTSRRAEPARNSTYNRSRENAPTYNRSSRSSSSNNTYRSAPSRRSSSPSRSTTTRSSSSSSRSSGTTTRSSGGRSSRGGRGGGQ